MRKRERERSEFGARLLLARTRAELTQPQLATAVGMSQSSLAEAEGVGKSSSFTVRIAERCGVSARWLECGDGDMLDVTVAWPFSPALYRNVLELRTDGLLKLEGVMRAHLGMTALPVRNLPEESTQLQAGPPNSDTVRTSAVHPYSRQSLQKLGGPVESSQSVPVQKQGRHRRSKGSS